MSTKAFDLYRLKGQPFELGRYNVKRIGRDVEWTRLRQIVNFAQQSRSPVNAVLLGTYGSGKSFLLWQLARSLQPATKSRVLGLGPIRLVDPEQKRDFTRSLVLRLFVRGMDIENDLVPILRNVAAPKAGWPSALRPFVSLLLALTRPDAAAVARKVLIGSRILRREAEAAGIAETLQIRTTDDAIAVIQALQLVLHAAGVTAIAMFIDEVEYVDALPRAQRVSVLDSLKHLWDQQVDFFSKGANAATLLILMAATPDYWHRLKQQVMMEGGRGESGVGITPFFARIRASEVVEMPAELAPDEARELIVSRMSEARDGQKRDEIIPFTDDYVDYAYQLSQGLPRQIIEICGVVLAEAAQRKLKKIDADVARKILSDLLISYEPISEKVS
ncbi:MAG: hypothetical protein M3O61_04780 [Gemmatimonadota bacterium]|nr:hypothetical protein [Gemmatimonadota bacterium]